MSEKLDALRDAYYAAEQKVTDLRIAHREASERAEQALDAFVAERDAAEQKASKRHSAAAESCSAERCREASGYQCDGCGHYFARGSGTSYASGEFLCQGCRTSAKSR